MFLVRQIVLGVLLVYAVQVLIQFLASFDAKPAKPQRAGRAAADVDAWRALCADLDARRAQPTASNPQHAAADVDAWRALCADLDARRAQPTASNPQPSTLNP